MRDERWWDVPAAEWYARKVTRRGLRGRLWLLGTRVALWVGGWVCAWGVPDDEQLAAAIGSRFAASGDRRAWMPVYVERMRLVSPRPSPRVERIFAAVEKLGRRGFA